MRLGSRANVDFFDTCDEPGRLIDWVCALTSVGSGRASGRSSVQPPSNDIEPILRRWSAVVKLYRSAYDSWAKSSALHGSEMSRFLWNDLEQKPPVLRFALQGQRSGFLRSRGCSPRGGIDRAAPSSSIRMQKPRDRARISYPGRSGNESTAAIARWSTDTKLGMHASRSPL